MQQALDYPTESQIMALQPQEFVNIRQTQEQINLLRRIANAISKDSSRSILSRLIILILLTCLYGWLTYDFYDANGFTLRATTDLFCMGKSMEDIPYKVGKKYQIFYSILLINKIN